MSNLLSVFSNLNLTRTLGGTDYCSHLTDKENEASEAEYLHKVSRESIRDLNLVSLVAQIIKNPSVMQETWVRSLGWDDPLEKEMATQSSILAWRSPRTEEPGGYSPWACKE
ncbi:unnamed protein product [Rangifer tarandus platyrhynchus]|uniref:Uncharacterized protein n=1 Tax=Rangifer tarandus platyrhynchus TaxID=3082113 RepID=A0AC59Z7V9_RANTA